MKILNKLVFSAFLSTLIFAHFCAWADEKSAEDENNKPAISNPIIQKGFSGSYLSGRFAQENGNIQDAISYLQKAHSDDPKDIDVASQLQGMLLLDGRVEEAIVMAEDIRATGSKDPVSSLLLALREVKKNNMVAADNMLDAAFDNESGQLWLPLISGWLDAGQGKLAKPLTIEELTAEVGRAAPIMNYHLALINSHAGFTDAAVLNFKNAIEDPKNPPPRVMQALIQFYNTHQQPEALKSLVEAYAQANPDATPPDSTPPVANVQDGVAEVLFTMGSIMLSADATQDATIYLRLALYVRPNFPVAALTLGDAYGELHQYGKSNDAYALIAQDSRFYISSQIDIANNYDHMERLKDALSLLDDLSKKLPDRYEPLAAKGDLLRMHGKFAEAAAFYTQSLTRVPQLKSSHWPILFARGACLERTGKWAAAQQDLAKALLLKPDQPEVLNYLGYSLMTRGEHLAEARAMIEKAVNERPNDAEIIDSMGWALYLGGNYNDAVAYIEKAVELLPADPTVNDHLGDVYWRQGRKTEARYQWERSLSFSPEASDANMIRKKIKSGLPPSAMSQPAPVVASDQHANAATQ